MFTDQAMVATVRSTEEVVTPTHSEGERAQPLLVSLTRLTGLPFYCCDARTGGFVGADESQLLPSVPAELLRQCVTTGQAVVMSTPTGLIHVAVPLDEEADGRFVACGHCLTAQESRPADLVLAAVGQEWPSDRLDSWIARLPRCSPETVERLVALAVRELHRVRQQDTVRDDYAQIAEELDYTYEELNLLHTLTQSMQISRSPREIAELSLERVGAVIPAEGHAIWLEDKREGRLFLIEGTLPFDEMGMARLIARFDGHDWPRALVRNHVAGTLLGSSFPLLRNFSLVAIGDGNLRFGWICSCNIREGQDFGSVQTSLLSSVASILGTHQHNLELYRQHENLLLSFVRSLVSTLDAKDAYTRGHSERVALIARRIGAQMGLPPEDLRDIYLSGLLHDIGKIGVDDQILRKSGQLTREEFEQVKRHPVIGYNILAGLRNLHAVLPGVRHHHEAFIGTGYPDGLKGDEIPLMARIIAVADSYDAMSSDRPYRKGLRLLDLEQILKDGAGRQWDPAVVAAYFSVRQDVMQICDSYSPMRGNLLSAQQDDDDETATVEPLRTLDDIRGALRAVAGL